MRLLSGILPVFLLFGFLHIRHLVSQQAVIQNLNNRDIQTEYSKDSYDVRFYKIDLNVSDTSIYISGSVLIKAEVVVQQVNRLSFDLVSNYLVDSVLVNSISSQFRHNSDILSIELPDVFIMGQIADILVYYHGKAYDSGEEKGIYNRKADPFGNYTYTLTEPLSAKYFYPCKQILTDKADSSYVFITTDSTLKAGSNGILEQTVKLPDGKSRYEWKSRHPIAYYLISMAVGKYVDYSFYVYDALHDDSILVVNYIYPEPCLTENKSRIDETGNFLLLFSEIYGPYPYADEKYGHCLVPLGGGMEHQTMTTLGNFSYLLVAHELAHQWFGDYVTCSAWQDIWINEGFASYSEYLALENLDSKESAMAWMENAHNYVKNIKTGSIYLPAEDTLNVKRIFDYVLSYKKGAAIIHMMRHELGNDKEFFRILRDFLSTYRNGNASGEDFKNFLQLQTGIDFTDFFNQWYYGEGFPYYTFSWLTRNDTLIIHSLQETSSETTPLFNTLMPFEVLFSNGNDTTISFRQLNNFQIFEKHLPGIISDVRFDPDKWLLSEVIKFGHIAEDKNPGNIYTIFPNPVKDELILLFDEEPGDYTIRIVDLSGKIIHSAAGTNQYEVINFKPYRKGPYILLIDINDHLYASKIIKY
ncbi:MAG: T9SS type A sorting domain-containing protein [Bacteroidales bacterium]|nr:T9SS type A sorting domain-containing protein [Bacteroidales bacterium]